MHGMHRNHGLHRGGRGGHGYGHGHGERDGLFGGRGRRGPDGPGGRRGKRFASEELRLMVLSLLESEPQHGYQLIRNFAEKSGDAYSPSPGMLYPLLTMLVDMGLIEETDDETSGSRRSFALTGAGKAEVEGNREAIAELFRRLASLAEMAGRTDAGPVRRAMMNLRAATVQRMGREGASDELALDVAAVLDEAAQRIERLK